MKNLFAISLSCAAFAVFAAPVVSDVTLTQIGETVHIGYTLSGEPGIVTVDIQTNVSEGVWASIGGEHLTYFAGDANRRVEPGARTITWKPRKAWPDNEVKENVKAVVSAWATNAPPDYMAVSLVVPGETRFYASAGAVPFGVTNDLYKTEWMLFRKCPAANVTWRMGSPSTEVGHRPNETPHLVTLADDYYIGVYLVTQRQYELLKSENPQSFRLESDYGTRPVEWVSYNMIRGSVEGNVNWPSTDRTVVSADSYVKKLRDFVGVSGFDLPTEAQWEFACRAGCGSALYNGMELDDVVVSTRLSPLARYAKNGGFVDGVTDPRPYETCTAANGTAKVGSYEPNAWGLYDMLGNMWEWCLDWFQEDASASDAATGPATGIYRVLRGGTWNSEEAATLRCAFRTMTLPSDRTVNFGFRLVCPAEVQ